METIRVAKILIVDDDKHLCACVSDWLLRDNYEVETVHDGMKGSDVLIGGGFDLVVLDWNLPGKSGVDLLKEFRDQGGVTPVILLTGKNSIDDKEEGFDVGADDYLTKPFQMKELSARIRAILRRPPQMLSSALKHGDIELDSNKHRLTRGGLDVHLSPRDFALFEFFMRNPQRIFSADVLLSRVWQTDSEATPEALRAAIRRIRRALDEPDQDESSSIIRNVPRVGYTLRRPH
jgi:DNA-binding response OmpR family regulator